MPIKLDIPFSEKDDAKKLGARWLADKKTWIIPNAVYDISPFQKWLPKEDGYFIRSPLFIAQSERPCWKCGRVKPQGDFYNFDVGGPFFPATEEEASQIAVERLPLDLDLYLRGDMSISNAYEWFIK